jgi:hypothetical protein
MQVRGQPSPPAPLPHGGRGVIWFVNAVSLPSAGSPLLRSSPFLSRTWERKEGRGEGEGAAHTPPPPPPQRAGGVIGWGFGPPLGGGGICGGVIWCHHLGRGGGGGGGGGGAPPRQPSPPAPLPHGGRGVNWVGDFASLTAADRESPLLR